MTCVNKNSTQGLVFHFLFTCPCACIHLQVYLWVCKYVLLFFHLNVYQFLSLWACLFVWLVATRLLSLHVMVCFDFATCFFYFYQSSQIIFHSIFSYIHWWRTQGIELKKHCLSLPVRCMSKPFIASTHYFVLFVLPRVTYCFCLF